MLNLDMGFIIAFLKSYLLRNLFSGKAHALGRADKLVLNVVFAVCNADNAYTAFLDGCIDSEDVNVQFLAVAAQNAFDISVINRV